MKEKFIKIWFVINFFIVFLIVKLITFFNKIFINNNRKISGKRIAFLALFEEEHAGHFFRVKLWADKLKENNYEVITITLMEKNDLAVLRSGDIMILIKQMYKRLSQCLKLYSFDTIIIRRTLLPFNEYGNLFFEKMILSINQNSILDFDDDMFNYKTSDVPKSLFGKLLMENKEKFKYSILKFNYFIVGSEYLKELTLNYNTSIFEQNVCVIPTCVNYNIYQPKQYTYKPEIYNIGWIGTNGNQVFLNKLIPVLNHLIDHYKFQLLVISDREFISSAAKFPIENIKWSRDEEIKLMYTIDIGVMPLNHNSTTKGKCGFKLIQYMGLGIVSIAESIGANNEILSCKSCGLLAYDESTWKEAFISIFNMDIDELNKMGRMAKDRIESAYTFDSNQNKYLEFLKSILSKSEG